jgi:hypothetical protein
MSIHHYIVDVWVEDGAITEDQLDTAIGGSFRQLQNVHNLDADALGYELTFMGEEDYQ